MVGLRLQKPHVRIGDSWSEASEASSRLSLLLSLIPHTSLRPTSSSLLNGLFERVGPKLGGWKVKREHTPAPRSGRVVERSALNLGEGAGDGEPESRATGVRCGCLGAV